MLTLLIAFAALAIPQELAQPQEQVFDDWAVACDNVGRCEATSLQAPEQFGDEANQVLISREAGSAGALSIAIDPAELVAGPVELFVDGTRVATGDIRENYRVSDAPAAALAKAMAEGRWLELRGGKRVLARISLTGIAATLRYIDTEQGRAGVPLALPQVPALRAATGVAETPSRALIGELAKVGGCALENIPDDLPVERYRLDAQATLVLIPCGSGAYNYNSAAFILRSGKGTPADFDTAPDWYEGDDPAILTNASFSTIDGAILTSSAKGRGIGDCGTAQRWVWDGKSFRMIEARVLGECRGSVNWLTVFRATPVWR